VRRQQRGLAVEMWRAMFADRMKLQVHYEPIDDPSFALTVARADGRLGRGLTRSTLDCDAVGAATRAGRPMPDLANGAGPCRMWESNDTILAGGITMAELARHLTGPSGRQVVDRTGLDGRWEFTLHFSRQERDPNAPLGLYPSVFTALQTELGLKLVPFVGKNKLLVIDHIEPPRKTERRLVVASARASGESAARAVPHNDRPRITEPY
jgi:uncharacterized protein (TIGR03435 family)